MMNKGNSYWSGCRNKLIKNKFNYLGTLTISLTQYKYKRRGNLYGLVLNASIVVRIYLKYIWVFHVKSTKFYFVSFYCERKKISIRSGFLIVKKIINIKIIN